MKHLLAFIGTIIIVLCTYFFYGAISTSAQTLGGNITPSHTTLTTSR